MFNEPSTLRPPRSEAGKGRGEITWQVQLPELKYPAVLGSSGGGVTAQWTFWKGQGLEWEEGVEAELSTEQQTHLHFHYPHFGFPITVGPVAAILGRRCKWLSSSPHPSTWSRTNTKLLLYISFQISMNVSTETTRAPHCRLATTCKGDSSVSILSAVRSPICWLVISKSRLVLGKQKGWGPGSGGCQNLIKEVAWAKKSGDLACSLLDAGRYAPPYNLLYCSPCMSELYGDYLES